MITADKLCGMHQTQPIQEGNGGPWVSMHPSNNLLKIYIEAVVVPSASMVSQVLTSLNERKRVGVCVLAL